MKLVRVVVNDLMQRGYVYHRTEPIGKNFHADFKPQLTPRRPNPQELQARRPEVPPPPAAGAAALGV